MGTVSRDFLHFLLQTGSKCNRLTLIGNAGNRPVAENLKFRAPHVCSELATKYNKICFFSVQIFSKNICTAPNLRNNLLLFLLLYFKQEQTVFQTVLPDKSKSLPRG